MEILNTPPMNPVFANLRTAYAAYRSPKPARWRSAECSADAMLHIWRQLQDDALAERGRVLAAALALPGLILPNTGLPPFLERAYQSGPGGLFDHISHYRVPGIRGPATGRTAVVITEPYLSDEWVPRALDDWTPQLAALGLSVRQLSKEWLTHAPDDPASQIFLVGAPFLIDRLA